MTAEACNDKDSGSEREFTPLELAEMKTGRRIGPIHQAPGFASRRRIKVKEGGACYHVMSRTVNGEFLFGEVEKEAFRRMMWRFAEFTGMEILTYAIMGNHFHLLLKVPQREKWLKRFEGVKGEQKLLDHLSTVYSKAFLKQLQGEIDKLRKEDREEEVSVMLDRFKKRFCDLSLFVKELKERFSRWFNKQNGRRGTLWMDRFKSVIVENGESLRAMAAYIDLNPVRAGLVEDPAESTWTGYGEAMSGSRRARRGLCKVVGAPQDSWEGKAAGIYRCWLYEEGASVGENDSMTGKKRPPRKRGFTVKQMVKVKEESGLKKGQPRFQKRVPAFSSGVVIGTQSYVQKLGRQYQEEFGRKTVHTEKPIQILNGENEEMSYSLRE